MREQVIYFKKHGITPTILTYSPDKKPRTEQRDGVTVIRTPYLHRAFPDAQGATQLDRLLPDIIRMVNPDAILGHNLTYPFGPKRSARIIAVCKKQFPGLPVLEYAHNAQNALNVSADIQKKLANLAWDHIFCVSKFAQSRFVAAGVPRRHTTAIYNGVDTSRFNPQSYSKKNLQKKYGLPVNRTYIVFPSRPFTSLGVPNTGKGFELLARALKIILKTHDNRYLVAPITGGLRQTTRDATFKKIQAFLLKLDIADHMVFLPECTPKTMPELYALGDVVVAPSAAESFGLVYAEAMAMQKPPVALATGAAPEIITDNHTGFLVRQNTPEALAQTIERVLAMDATQRAMLGTRARQRIIRHFSIEQHTKRVCAAVSKIIKHTT
ncbi:hypothetical protein BK004_03035 [bacterium CG10_46_32]|nr:MAG: hypothetical protein BK004_03035 [bacterium CG10_46_32]